MNYPRRITANISVKTIEDLIAQHLHSIGFAEYPEIIENMKFGSDLITGTAEVVPISFDIVKEVPRESAT